MIYLPFLWSLDFGPGCVYCFLNLHPTSFFPLFFFIRFGLMDKNKNIKKYRSAKGRDLFGHDPFSRDFQPRRIKMFARRLKQFTWLAMLHLISDPFRLIEPRLAKLHAGTVSRDSFEHASNAPRSLPFRPIFLVFSPRKKSGKCSVTRCNI